MLGSRPLRLLLLACLLATAAVAQAWPTKTDSSIEAKLGRWVLEKGGKLVRLARRQHGCLCERWHCLCDRIMCMRETCEAPALGVPAAADHRRRRRCRHLRLPLCPCPVPLAERLQGRQ